MTDLMIKPPGRGGFIVLRDLCANGYYVVNRKKYVDYGLLIGRVYPNLNQVPIPGRHSLLHDHIIKLDFCPFQLIGCTSKTDISGTVHIVTGFCQKLIVHKK